MNSPTEDFENRKKDHIRLANDPISQRLVNPGFDRIKLQHQALPEINFDEVHINTHILGHEFASPHFVSSMTAGHEQSLQINLNLATAAEKMNWMMAVGSQRRELTDINAIKEWDQIKKQVPKLKFISNIGLVELIQHPVEQILQVTKSLDAIALFVHLNPLQEVFQDETKAQFKGGLKAIEKLVRASEIPILVKEVGFGLNEEIVRKLFEVGVRAVDLSGHGGTHWALIEAARQKSKGLGLDEVEAFKDWGSSTVDLLLEMQASILFHPIWASGGVRSGVDSAKCLAMGARAVGLAQPLMKAAVSNQEEVLKVMKKFDDQLKVALFCTGMRKCDEFLIKKVWTCLK